MGKLRLTTAQALVKFLDNQYLEVDGVELKFVKGIFAIFGHGNVLGLGLGQATIRIVHHGQTETDNGAGAGEVPR
ncbi:hypothetical protein CQA81_31185 [Klebsiella pneumoniae]|nr:hypothetical protein CQA81_31185 [Klebsiella pneumoniae]